MEAVDVRAVRSAAVTTFAGGRGRPPQKQARRPLLQGRREAGESGPREVNILALLYENAGRPVLRERFLDACWGLDYFPESRTLDQHIANLRKRIEADPGNPLIIETIRGMGYRFRPWAKRRTRFHSPEF